MTDERGLIPRAEAMQRARDARRRAPDDARGLHDLLRDMAAYLGDRPNRDTDAMALYGRVMAMLGDGQG